VVAEADDARSLGGNTGGGSYTLTGSLDSSSTTTASDVNQGVTATGTTTQTRSSTWDRGGDRWDGTYSLHDEATWDSTSSGGSGQQANPSGGGAVGGHTLADAGGTVGSGRTTTDRRGNDVSGTYSLHETATGTTTVVDAASDLSEATTGGADTDRAGASATATTVTSDTTTLDRWGNAVAGDYTLYQTVTSGWTADDGSSAQDTVAESNGDGEWEADGETGTAFGSGNTTLFQQGSDHTGSYSLFQTSGSTSTAYEQSTGQGTVSETDGDAGGSVETVTVTSIGSGSVTLERQGNAVSGTYSLHETSTSGSTVRSTTTDAGSGAWADGETETDGGGASATTTLGGTVVNDRFGNEVVGTFSLHQVTGPTASFSDSSDETDGDGDIEGDTDSEEDIESDVGGESGLVTADTTGNDTLGVYSLHQTGTSDSTEYPTSTRPSTIGEADGAAGGGTVTVTSTVTQHNANVLDRTWDAVTGSYSLHEVNSTTATIRGGSTDRSSMAAADTSTGRSTLTDDATTYEYGLVTADRYGNDVSGEYSLHETGGTSATVYDTAGSQGTASEVSGDTDGDDGGSTSTAYSFGTRTLDRSGNEVSGFYTLFVLSGSSSTATETEGGTTTMTGVDTSAGRDTGGGTLTTYGFSTDTLSRTGNDRTRGYSLFEISTSSSTVFDSSTDVATLSEPDGEYDGDTAGESGSAYRYARTTVSRYGNDETRGFSEYATGSTNATTYRLSSDTATTTETAGDSERDTGGGTVTTIEDGGTSSSSTMDGTSNWSSVHRYGSSTATVIGSGSTTVTGTAADTSNGRSVDDSTVTTYQFGDDTFDEARWADGSYSLHETTNSSATVFDGSTDSDTASEIDGEYDLDGGGGDASRYMYNTVVRDQTKTHEGSYSLHEVTTADSTVFGTSTGTSTVTAANGSTDRGTGTTSVTTYAHDGATLDRQVAPNGSYSLHQTSTSSSTVIESSTDTDTTTETNLATDADTAGGNSTVREYGSSTIDEQGDASGYVTAHDVSTTDSTAYRLSTDTVTSTNVDTSTERWVATGTVTSIGHGTDDRGEWSNNTGAYSVHETTSNSSTVITASSDQDTVFETDGATNPEADSASGTNYSFDTSTFGEFGNSELHTYTIAESGDNSATAFGNSGGSGTAAGANSSVDRNTASASGTTYESGGYTIARWGDERSGTYSSHEEDTSSSTVIESSGNTETLSESDGDWDRDVATARSTAYQYGSHTTDRHGNNTGRTYTLHETRTDSGSVVGDSTDQNTEGAAGGGTDVDDSSDTGSSYHSGTWTLDRTANEASGSYSVHESSGNTSTTYDTATEQGLSDTSTMTAVTTWDHRENGNSRHGDYTLTDVATADSTTPEAGTDARGSFSGTVQSHATSTTNETGVWHGDSYSSTVEETHSTTADRSGGDVNTSYSLHQTAGGNSTTRELVNDGTGADTRSVVATDSSTSTETAASSTTTYTLTESAGSSWTDSVVMNWDTGASTASHDETSSSSLHETGSEGADAYTLDKTADAQAHNTRVSDADSGEYTLTGTSGETSTAVETMSHAGNAATFTEILTEDVTASTMTGDDNTGEYSLSESGTRSADFNDVGANAGGGFSVAEGSNGTFSRDKEGNAQTGEYTVTERAGTTYSATEAVTGTDTFTLVSRGVDSATVTDTGSGTTGGYTRTEDGTDVYTVTETGSLSGGAFSETATGTDTYTGTEVGNKQTQVFDRTTTGGGSYTRTVGGPGAVLAGGSSTNGYTLTEHGDERAGHFSQTETGTDRYGLVERFDDVSNANGGATPGNITFHTHGLLFRDPEVQVRRDTSSGFKPTAHVVDGDKDVFVGIVVYVDGQPYVERNGYRISYYEVTQHKNDWLTSDEWASYIRESALRRTTKGAEDLPPLTISSSGIGKRPVQKLNDKIPAMSKWEADLLNGLGDLHTHMTEPLPGSPTSIAGKLTPVVGNGRDAVAAWNAGRYDRAMVSGGLAVLDAFVVKDIAVGIGKGVSWLTGKSAATAGKEAGQLAAEAGAKAGTQTGVATGVAGQTSLKLLGPTCFVAGTLLLTPDGAKPVEEFCPGDQILSRPETDVTGPLAPKVIEEVFVRTGPILWLAVSGRRIGTTHEHPFYVVDKGWRTASQLEAGDLLASHTGSFGVVEAVVDVGEVATVYNMRVADWHTYFVGCEQWGFSVWVHNASDRYIATFLEIEENGKNVLRVVILDIENSYLPVHWGNLGQGPVRTFETIAEAEVAIAGIELEAARAAAAGKAGSPNKLDLSGKSSGGAEHTTGARGSTQDVHQAGQTRKQLDYGGEKGDARRAYPRKRPADWTGPWPPKEE
jgi:hypothetical protein